MFSQPNNPTQPPKNNRTTLTAPTQIMTSIFQAFQTPTPHQYPDHDPDRRHDPFRAHHSPIRYFGDHHHSLAPIGRLDDDRDFTFRSCVWRIGKAGDERTGKAKGNGKLGAADEEGGFLALRWVFEFLGRRVQWDVQVVHVE
jgi:hypothetical protein